MSPQRSVNVPLTLEGPSCFFFSERQDGGSRAVPDGNLCRPCFGGHDALGVSLQELSQITGRQFQK